MPSSAPRINLLIVILAAVAGLATGFAVYRSGSTYTAPAVPAAGAEAFNALKGLKADFSILRDERFRALRVFGEQPVAPAPGGKQDLFSPF